MSKLEKSALMRKLDDTRGVFYPRCSRRPPRWHLGNPAMLMYVGTEKDAPGVSTTGWLTATSTGSCCKSTLRCSSSQST
jgi:hypothetical protein